MSPVQSLPAAEGLLGEPDRRKRLGQFLTGTALGRLLAALASARQARSIVDPMEGSGDLIAACLELGSKPVDLAGIEIDPIAHNVSQKRLPMASHHLGSAFDASVLRCLTTRKWDLVITNPPYVRYQRMAKRASNGLRLPGAVEVRNDLIASLKEMSALDDEDKRLFQVLASSYSGLADLAVPSWILCASMVAVGGRLALVLPESWLSREYAAVVHYLLLRWFHIEHIVEDEHAVWFDDAQVKTTLLVARRVVRRSTAFGWEHERYVRSRISGIAAGLRGPISRLYVNKEQPESLFAADAERVLTSNEGIHSDLLTMVPTSIAAIARTLQGTAQNHKWFRLVGETPSNLASSCEVPPALASWIGRASRKPQLTTLETLGVSIGQGLRTGANGFFYATVVSESPRKSVVMPDGALGTGHVAVPKACLRPVIRRQSELPVGFSVHTGDLTGRALDFRNIALPEDIEAGGVLARSRYSPMSETLAAFVRHADQVDFGKGSEPRRIRTLSAVAPNIRRGDVAKGAAPRYWYMLPDFAPRHMPDIIVPRINARNAKAVLIADKGILADANFATLNVESKGGINAYSILALINSSWCRALLEHSGAVMGGGALKIEAAHLRRLPVPRLTPPQWKRLSALGKRLAEEGKGLPTIDRLVASGVLGHATGQEETAALMALAEEGRNRRDSHKKNKGNLDDDDI